MKVRSIEFALRSTRPGEYPAERLPEIAFVGRSNVGKSRLINSLLGRKNVAKTSRTPGKTRSIDWFRIQGGTGACYFVDLPGYGFAKVPRKVREENWATFIDTYLTSEQPLELTLQLLDIRRDGPTKLDEQMIEWLRETGTPHTFVLTKSDKLKQGKRMAAVKSFAAVLQTANDNPPIPYSAVSGEGKRELWSLIDRRLSEASRPPTSDPVSESVNTT